MCVGTDGKIYCTACCPRLEPLPAEVDTSKILAEEGGGCPRCGGRVFDPEKVTIKAGAFHKKQVFHKGSLPNLRIFINLFSKF